jgi:hypothetical protein
VKAVSFQGLFVVVLGVIVINKKIKVLCVCCIVLRIKLSTLRLLVKCFTTSVTPSILKILKLVFSFVGSLVLLWTLVRVQFENQSMDGIPCIGQRSSLNTELNMAVVWF